MCFRFNGCWPSFRCYSLLSVVFHVFHGHPSHGSLAQDILSLSSRTFSCCVRLQLGPWWCPTCQDIAFRRQFAISFSHRSECFFIALRCFRVSSSRLHGSLSWGHGHVYQKAMKGKSRRYVRTNILHPYPSLPSPLHSTPSNSHLPHPFPPRRLARRSSSARSRVAYLCHCL
jgi:hypothetical protein